MDTLHQVSNKKTGTSQMRCLKRKIKKKKERKKKNLPVLYGKPDFNVSILVTAE